MADEQSDKSEAVQTETPPTAGAGDAAPSDASADATQMAEQALADAQNAVDQLQDGPNADGQDGQTTPNMDLPNFQQVLADVESSGIGLLHDVDLDVKIELGRTEMLVEDVLKLAEGSVVELDKLAGDPWTCSSTIAWSPGAKSSCSTTVSACGSMRLSRSCRPTSRNPKSRRRLSAAVSMGAGQEVQRLTAHNE